MIKKEVHIKVKQREDDYHLYGQRMKNINV